MKTTMTVAKCQSVNCSREPGHPGLHRSRVIEVVNGVHVVSTTEWRDEDAAWDDDATTETWSASSG